MSAPGQKESIYGTTLSGLRECMQEWGQPAYRAAQVLEWLYSKRVEGFVQMSSLPAGRMGLEDRERVAEGTWADLVVFDPATVADKSTFQNPHQYPEGITYVIVNGVPVVDNGKWSGAGPGQVLRRPGS